MKKLLLLSCIVVTVALPAFTQKSSRQDTQKLGMALDYLAAGKYHEALVIFAKLDEKKAKLLDEILTLDFNQINELFKRIGKT